MFQLKRNLRRSAASIVTASVVVLALSAAPQLSWAEETHVAISPAAYGSTRTLEVEINKTALVDLPAGAAEVIVSQPGVAAAIMRTRTRALVQGVAAGDTNMFFIDDRGQTIAVLDVTIVQPTSEVGRSLEATLARVIPGSNIRVETLSDNADVDGTTHFVLTGTVLTAQDKAVAEALASDLSDGDEETGSLIQVIGPQQVMLQVTVSEVNRSTARQFGINLSGALSVGSVNLGFNNAVTSTSNGFTAGYPGGNLQINASIRALEERGALRVLAQPTLTAISGEQAKFLAGGELPYVQVDSNGNPTTLFKPYGVELGFLPVVKSNGLISIKVNTSVSEPQANMSLTRREADTSVELAAGTTLAIGGLLQETSRQQIDQFPFLGDIPILGALFRSRDYQSQQTELVILVTPYLVQPSPANAIPVPTDGAVAASDAEGIFLGRLESIYGVGKTGEMRGSFSGSVGFVLD